MTETKKRLKEENLENHMRFMLGIILSIILCIAQFSACDIF